jgi:hypothetical protein
MITSVEDVREAKEKCEDTINRCLRSFEKATGLKVYSVTSEFMTVDQEPGMTTNCRLDVRI